jgi:Carboxypeptidase regulatory-like domain
MHVGFYAGPALMSILTFIGVSNALVPNTLQLKEAATTGFQGAPTSAACSVEGSVVRLGTNEPIQRAQVTISSTSQRRNYYSGLTDASGRFTVEGLAPDRYKVRVHKVGYLTQDYGEDSPGGVGTAVPVCLGESMKNFSFRMVPEGVIFGRITFEDGTPAVGAIVKAFRSEVHRGQRKLFASATAEANDLGEYRLYDLPPRPYYVRAESREQYVKEAQGYAAVFYPGSWDAKGAIAVNVPPGQEVPLSDVTLVPTSAVTIRGHVFNAISGKPLNGCCVFLEPGGDVVLDDSGPGRPTDSEGAFEIENVPSGSFVLRASAFAEGKWHHSMLPIEVQNANLDNLDLTIRPEVSIAGRISVQSSDPVRLSMFRVLIEGLGLGYSGIQSAEVRANGSFQMLAVPPGRYEVKVEGGPTGAYVESVQLHGEKSPDNTLDLTSGSDQGLLEILLNSAGCQVDGNVTDGGGLSVALATIALIPQGDRRKNYALYKVVKSDSLGRFVINGVPPGEYELFAWKEIEYGRWEDPDFLAPLEHDSVRVTTEDHEHKSVELRAIQDSAR